VGVEGEHSKPLVPVEKETEFMCSQGNQNHKEYKQL
jgi:hypothetical protein